MSACERCALIRKAELNHKAAVRECSAYQELLISAVERDDARAQEELKQKSIDAFGRTMDAIVTLVRLRTDHEHAGGLLGVLLGGAGEGPKPSDA